jgi:hypothetical protein
MGAASVLPGPCFEEEEEERCVLVSLGVGRRERD